MELSELIGGISQRYAALEETEKEALRELRQSAAGMALAKVLGPELGPLLNQLAPPKAKSTGLGAR